MTHELLVWLLAIGVILGSLLVAWIITVVVGFAIVFTKTMREPKKAALQDRVDKLFKETWLDL